MFFKNISFCSAIAAIFFFCSCTSNHAAEHSTAELFVMDTVCSVNADKDDIKTISSVLSRIDTALDCFSKSGEIHALNEKRSMNCSEDLCDFIKKTTSLSAEYGNEVIVSGGAVTMLWKEAQKSEILPEKNDILHSLGNIGDNFISFESGNVISLKNECMLDSGAFAKGYALDLCRDVLDSSGNSDYAVISMTSSVLLYGKKPDNSKFNVEIRNPDGNGIIGTVKTDACFLSTSGGYERFFTVDGENYPHIIDLSTGYPTQSDLTSVTVFCDSGILSDYLSTKILIEGTENIENHLESDLYKVAAFDENGNSYISKGLDFHKK